VVSKRYYSKKNLLDIRAKYQTVEGKTNDLLLSYVGHPFKNEKAKEYAHHGFARRIQTLHRCIHNLFKVVPPGTIKVPNKARLHDAQINLQAFVANVYGSVDNLAWTWMHERGLAAEIKPRQVGLRAHNTQLRKSLSSKVQTYLKGLDAWFDYVADFRHALAHRIPLYIPPGGVRPRDIDTYNALQRRINDVLNQLNPAEYDRLSSEQARLFVFQPVMTHSLSEAKGVVACHAQVIVDFLTVEELALKMLAELRGLSSS
jgi:hypothetical protein